VITISQKGPVLPGLFVCFFPEFGADPGIRYAFLLQQRKGGWILCSPHVDGGRQTI